MSELLNDNLFNQLIDNDNLTKHQMVLLLAHIDTLYYASDSITEWNNRLRDSIGRCFNKIGLSPSQTELFGSWFENVNNIHIGSSRYEIFNCAPEECLSIVGI